MEKKERMQIRISNIILKGKGIDSLELTERVLDNGYGEMIVDKTLLINVF